VRDRRLRSNTERVRRYVLNVFDVYSPPLSVRTVFLDLLPGLPLELCWPPNVDLVRVQIPLDRIRPKEARRLVPDRHHVAIVRDGPDWTRGMTRYQHATISEPRRQCHSESRSAGISRK
jgi:hypothetical protein